MYSLKPRVGGAGVSVGVNGRGAVGICLCFSPSVAWSTGIHIRVAQALRLRPLIEPGQHPWVGSRRNTGEN